MVNSALNSADGGWMVKNFEREEPEKD